MTTTLRLLTLALLTSSTLVLTDCHKTADSVAPALTERERFLTTPNWHFAGATEVRTTPAGVVTTRNFDGFDPCATDDLTHYKSDRTYAVAVGPVTCSYRPATTGTWDFASNEAELLVTDAGQTDTAHHQIQALTATTLSYVFSQDTFTDGTRVELIVTFTAR